MHTIVRSLTILLLALLLAPGPLAAGAPLQTFPNTIAGSVTLDGAPLVGASVRVAGPPNPSGFVAVTGSNGGFSVSVPDGSWTVRVEPGPRDLWMYTEPRAPVAVGGSGPTRVDLALTVQRTTGFLAGRVLADGRPLPLPPPSAGVEAPYVDVFDVITLVARQAPIDATGTFTVPLVPGLFQAVIAFDTSYYGNYEAPLGIVREITSGRVDLGTIPLLRRDATISGRVTVGGRGAENLQVQAIRSGGGYASAVTAPDGSYSLSVAAGEWEVSSLPDLTSGAVDFQGAVSVSVDAGSSQQVDLELTPAAAQLAGQLEVDGVAVTDVSGWAYAREAATGRYVAYGPIVGGSFMLSVPAGDLRVGVFLAAGSPYSLVQELATVSAVEAQLAANPSLSAIAADAIERRPFEQLVRVRPGTSGALAARPISVRLERNDAQIVGTLRDANGQPLTGVAGTVAATPLGAAATWQQTAIDPRTGAYSLNVSRGVWVLSYSLGAGSENFAPTPGEELQVLVGPGASVTREITLRALDGVLAGRVLNQQRQPVPGALVWVEGNGLQKYVLSDAQGVFVFRVPLRAGGAIARYTLGMLYDCEDKPVCYVSSEPITVQASRFTTRQNPSITIEVGATASGTNVLVSGTVKLNGQVNRSVRVVTGRPDDDELTNVSGAVGPNDEGRYTTTVPFDQNSGRLAVRSVGKLTVNGKVRSGSVDKTVLVTAGLAQQELPLDVGALELREVATLPASVVATFTVAEGWRQTLADGTSIEIPPGAVPLAANDSVRVVIEPVGTIFSSELHQLASYYGYAITLFDAASGIRLGDTLRAPALLTMRYDDDAVWANGAMEARLLPARQADALWEPAANFTLVRGANRVSLQTSELGTWALVEPTGRGCGACVFVPLLRR